MPHDLRFAFRKPALALHQPRALLLARASRNLTGALAQRSLQLFELRELLRAKTLALRRKVPREPEQLVAVDVVARRLPVVTFPRIAAAVHAGNVALRDPLPGRLRGRRFGVG